MKKKKVVLIVLLSLCAIIGLCIVFYHKGWKRVEITDVGSLVVPTDWQCCEEDERKIFCDEYGNVVMEEVPPKMFCVFDDDAHIEGVLYYNSAYWWKCAVTIDGVLNEYYCLDLGGDINLIIYDEDVTKNDVIRMAKSFV